MTQQLKYQTDENTLTQPKHASMWRQKVKTQDS